MPCVLSKTTSSFTRSLTSQMYIRLPDLCKCFFSSVASYFVLPLCKTQCGRHLMSHASRQRLPDVAEKGRSDPSSAMSKWPVRWPWYQRSITLHNVAVLWPRRLTTRCLPRLTPLPLRLLTMLICAAVTQPRS